MWPTHYIPYQERIESTPPPRSYLTSCRYPYELIEEMASSGSFVSAQPGEETMEEMSSSGSFVSGLMVTYGYQAITITTEEIESVGSFIGGELVPRLRFIDAGRDEIESVGSFVSGVMTDPLIYYLNWPLIPDELESTGSFDSGALT